MSTELERYRGDARPTVPLSRAWRDERAMARVYANSEMEHALHKADVQRAGDLEVAVGRAAGEIAWNAQRVAEALGQNRDAAVARNGETLTAMEVDRITDACQGALMELTVSSIRGLRDRR